MSFKLAVLAFEAKVGSPLRKLVLLKLADQANDDGICWPSYETIAEACEVDRRSVMRHVKKLEEDGFLRVERVYDTKNKKNASNRYHLTIEEGLKKQKCVNASSDNLSLGVVSDCHQGGGTESLGVVTDCHQGSDTESPKPIIEPINIEPINESINSETDKKTKKAKTAKKKQKHDFVDFYFTDNQKSKCSQYGININELLNEFKDYHGARGNQFVDWSQAFNTWINNHIKFNKLNPIAQGNNHAINQPDNNPSNEQPKKSSADIYAEKLAREFEQRYGQQSTAIRDVN